MDQDSRESGLNGDGDKQILAPSEGPREHLINTAMKFLQNPKVMTSPLYQRKAFLEKKGLTQEEIDIAVDRSGVKDTQVETAKPGPPPGYQANVIGAGNSNLALAHYDPLPPQSRWVRARDLTMTTVIVASVSYAVYQFFQRYLQPWLLGKSAQDARMERLEKQIVDIQRSVSDSLADITRTLSTIQVSLQNSQTQYSFGGNERNMSDLKADIASLKGLLLNRSQFPPAPSTSAMLPAWQRVTSSCAPSAAAINGLDDSVSTSPNTQRRSSSANESGCTEIDATLTDIVSSGHVSEVQRELKQSESESKEGKNDEEDTDMKKTEDDGLEPNSLNASSVTL